jgi:hypothetical protein
MLIAIIAIAMTGLTVAVHTFGVVSWLDLLSKRFYLHRQKKEYLHLLRGVLETAVVLIILHVFEAFLWAALYLQLPAQAGLKNFEDALYLSTVTLTTLGYGDITLNGEWRLLTGAEGMVGIVVFGLTTATLFSVLQRSWQFDKNSKHPSN